MKSAPPTKKKLTAAHRAQLDAARPAADAARAKIPKQTKSKAARIAEAQAMIDKMRETIADLSEGLQGAPTAYRPEFAIRATGLCMLGLTNEELAARFNVDKVVLGRWMRDIPEFRSAVYDGREGADGKIVNALYKAGIGFEHDEDDIRTVSRGGNDGSEIVITPTTKRYPPNYAALAMWLNNRQRERWSKNAEGAGDKNPTELASLLKEALDAAESKVPQRSKMEREE